METFTKVEATVKNYNLSCSRHQLELLQSNSLERGLMHCMLSCIKFKHKTAAVLISLKYEE